MFFSPILSKKRMNIGKALIAKGQVTITTLEDAYHISQTVGEYVFPASSAGTVVSAITVVSTIKVVQGNTSITNFTIGTIIKPAGFSAITVNNAQKTVTYSVAANTTTLAEHGSLTVPVLLDGVTYSLSFGWAKARSGNTGESGKDANLLDWVKDWNTNKTQIDGKTIVTPKIFAGVKHSNDTLTGVAIGQFALNVKDASGNVTTETVEGIYGFNEGNKTFFIDAGGNAQLGRDKQFIKYNALTGKVEFGPEVSLHWIGATYIDANGIFTGTLSADTVNALRLNASQITSGTIAASRIDVSSLKASLITSSNIEALHLNVTKGTIGGWTIDSDSIYRGTKNNIFESFTNTSGAVTLGSSGLRGFKWRLDATGAGAIAGGNISWDTSGNVTFSPSVALVWSTPISALTTALGGSGYPKLTKITAEGIYTGSLTASQLTAGTISVDRLGAGSITASKLDASSIRSSIINTDYINGLSCTFIQGKIGGWTIGSSSLTGTHIALDNGNKRMVVYGANSGVTSGQRVQLYYNSDTDFGFYATDTSGNCVAQLGAANKIAGWIFNTSQIYKNNVYLNSDGSIVNGTKWKLNNDGSGQIANGAITWNSAGTVSFSSTVSLHWINAIESIQIGGSNLLNNSSEWREAGWNGGYTSNGGGYTIDNNVTFNGKPTLKTDVGTGLVHNSWLKLETNVEYTYSAMVRCNKSITGNGSAPLHYWAGLDNQNQGKLTIIKYDTSVTANVWKRIFITFKLTGDGNSFRPFFYRGTNESTFYQIAYFKLERGNKSTDWSQSVSDASMLSSNAQNTANGVVNALGGSGYPKLTKIDSTGIYTGTLVASQITSGTISADRIATNSLNGNKIVARSITADRIISQAITANEIKTRTITADRIVSASITANEIASRTITAANIQASAITAYEIAGSTITAAEIASRTITAAQIKASAITAYEIAGSTITAAEIASRTITASKIAAGTITSTEINAGSIQAAVVTATAINGLTCDFKKGKVGGFILNDHALFSINVTAGHTIGIQNNGYIYNCNSSTNVDYWSLNTDGSAMFGTGKIKFNADGSGYVANRNIVWDVSGNVTMSGKITATSGKIAGFTISGNRLINTASDSSIEFSSMIGNASLYINSSTSLISMRADSSRTGISIQTYATGARGIYIVANAGSKYAIESYGPVQLGQRSSERWSVPGVLYVGCKYSTGYNNYYRKIWGDGVAISSFSHIGDGKYRVYHNLNHTDYTVMAILWSSTGYYGFFRLLERASNYFVIQNIGSSGKADAGAFDFVIMGRNVW